MTATTLSITKDLINRKSITPEDAGCQQLMIDFLILNGFTIEKMPFEDVSNFWATKTANTSISDDKHSPLILFAGHTDVVPPGAESQWQSEPFVATEKDGFLYGRGAADMKSSLASMLLASQQFLKQYNNFNGTIAFLITSDEEGPYINGTVRVLEELTKRGQKIDYCVVGEPSSIHSLGDQIRIGRRGSLTGFLKVHGIQGHVAYPEQCNNAIHNALSPLLDLSKQHWDDGNEFFPPTSFQITKFNSGTAGNVVPGIAEIEFNFRFSTEQTAESIKQKVNQLFSKNDFDFTLDWNLNGNPFLTSKGKLISAVSKAIKRTNNNTPILSTGGGTSDGRFIAMTGAEVIELGHCSATIHKANELVKISDLDPLTNIYKEILKELLL